MASSKPGFVNILQEFSIPLIAGVLAALVFANVNPTAYDEFIHFGPFDAICANAEPGGVCVEPHGHHGDDALGGHANDGHADGDHGDGDHADDGHGNDSHADDADGEVADNTEELEHARAEEPHDHGTLKPVFGLFGHHLTLHFIINDIFMLFFFGIAAKEITESLLPGGALNPPSKAINPLLGTLGGVLGPVCTYFLLAYLFYGSADAETQAAVYNGWGVPTATDIALAWLVARLVFGATHPAVNFLLLLAIADDAIGLGIIAIFYPSQEFAVTPIWLLLVLAGMAVSLFLRKRGTQKWLPYIVLGGLLSWIGLVKAALHPALALVPIVPFLPGPNTDTGLFSSDDEESTAHPGESYEPGDHSPLHNFEHDLKLFVDLGLFFFGLMNAGVVLGATGNVTWIVLGALLFGKTAGIMFFSGLGNKLGFPYPDGMSLKHVGVAGIVAGMGLTVALFVAGEAFPGGSEFLAPAKMGALLSAGCGFLAFVVGRALNVKELDSK